MKSLRWRLSVWGLFAVGAALELSSWQAGFAWYLVLTLASAFDAILGRSYLTANATGGRQISGILFAWGCAFSSMVFAAMPLLLAAQGGGSGRVLAVLMAASAFMRVMVFMSRARRLMIILGAPALLALIAMPFIPFSAGSAGPFQGALGVGCGVIAFLAYVVRAALNQNAALARMEAAHRQARERQLEAEAKRVEAVEANRAKSEFLTVMTHELRTPLNAVIGYAELIQEEMDAMERADVSADATRISASGRHLLGLIDQILSLTSADAGQDAVAPCDVDVRRLLDEAVAAIQEQARIRANRISIRVGDDAERAFTDLAKMSVCVSALLTNAVKFTENGLIGVTAEREDVAEQAWLRISIADTGVGVAMADQERIFTPFTRVDGSATRSSGGLGLGLSVARRLARRMGGDISVASEPGRGATFTLLVPLRHRAPLLAREAA